MGHNQKLIKKAIRIEKNKDRSQVYVVLCECGREMRVQTSKKHSGKCMVCSQRKEPYLSIFNKLKRQTQERGMLLTITLEDYTELISSGKCHYCEDELIKNPYRRKDGTINTSYQLDRKDNNRGYEKDNLVPCCWQCNNTRGNRFSYEEFLQLAPILKKIVLERKQT